MDYSAKSYGEHKPTFKSSSWNKSPTIPANIIHICHVGFHVDFSSSENVMRCGPKPPSCKSKADGRVTLNQWEFKEFSRTRAQRLSRKHGLRMQTSYGPSISCVKWPSTGSHVTNGQGHFTHETESPWPITLQALSLVENAEQVQVRFTLRSRDQWSMRMQDGCDVFHDSYMASNGSCFMVTWIVSINHFLEVCLTQNRKTMVFQMLTTVDLFYYFIMCEDRMNKIHWICIWSRAQSHTTSHYTWGSVTALHDFGDVLGRRPSDTFFWALTISWSRLLARVWSGPPRFSLHQVSIWTNQRIT